MVLISHIFPYTIELILFFFLENKLDVLLENSFYGSLWEMRQYQNENAWRWANILLLTEKQAATRERSCDGLWEE